MEKNKRLERFFSGAPWEKQVGYCRAIRAGDLVMVSGTTSLNRQGEIYAEGDAFGQTQRCLEIIEASLSQWKLNRSHVIRTRIFVTDIDRWSEYGKAHREFFANHPPATSMIEVKRLIDSRMVVEIEADAWGPSAILN